QGYDEHKSSARPFLMLESPGPFNVDAGWQGHAGRDGPATFLDELARIASAHVEPNVVAQQSIFPLDGRRALNDPHIGNDFQRHRGPTVPAGYRQLTSRFLI